MSDTIEFRHNDQAHDWANSTDRVPVFSVVRDNPDFREDAPGEQTGERTITVTYTMPRNANAGLALRYLKMARQNADVAAGWLLELAIGEEGYDALTEELSNEPDPDKALATQRKIIGLVAQRALGGLQGKA